MTRHICPADAAALLEPARAMRVAEQIATEALVRITSVLACGGVLAEDRVDPLEYLEAAISSLRKNAADHIATVRGAHCMRDEDDQETIDNCIGAMPELREGERV